jgi:hypothetical protein
VIDSEVQCPVLKVERTAVPELLFTTGIPVILSTSTDRSGHGMSRADASFPRDKAAAFGDTIKSTLCNTTTYGRLEVWA